MNQQQPQQQYDESPEATLAKDAIPDFEDLYCRHLTGHYYRVLHLSEGENRAYKVDLKEPSCSCPDWSYNREEPAVCKHMAYALFQAPERIEIEEAVMYDVIELLQGNALVPYDDGAVPEVEADQATQEEVTESVQASEAMDDGSNMRKPEELIPKVENWVRDTVGSMKGVSLGAGNHAGTPGITVDLFKPDMDERDFDYAKKKINELEGSEYHAGWMDGGCDGCGKSDGEGWYLIPVETAGGL